MLSRALSCFLLAACAAPAPRSAEPVPDQATAPSAAAVVAATPIAESPELAAPPEPRSAALAEAIEKLPIVATIEDLGATTFVLRGNLEKRRAATMEAMARHVISDVNARFFAEHDADAADRAPIDVCLFEDDPAYLAFAEIAAGSDSEMGFYLPSPRLIVANLGRSVGNLRHELVHPLVGDDFRAGERTLPAWFNEGLGSLYGTSKVSREGVRFLVNYRLRDVRKAVRSEALPTLAEIAASGRDELYGPRSMTYYATARYLLLYLEAKGELGNFYRELRGQDATAERQLALLEKYVDYDGFVGWTARLVKGSEPHKPAAKKRAD